MNSQHSFAVPPSASRLTQSLRDVGYDFPSAIADVVDNSIAAGARRIHVHIEFAGADSFVTIADDGCGMSANQVTEALRFGSRREYGVGDLGRYGLGLKTASLSQARSVSVVSQSRTGVVTARTLDLDLIEELDEWIIIDPGQSPAVSRSRSLLATGFRTVITWQNLDRVLVANRPDGAHSRRRVMNLIGSTSQHLAMVFHRLLGRIRIFVNNEELSPWDPFARNEARTQELPPVVFEVETPEGTGVASVRLERFVLPSRDQFSSSDAFESLSGPLKWNRQQGLYIYRADRLVQWGGWAGARAIDEHTKLARAALSFDTPLDDLFNTNVAKMRVSIPSAVRQQMTPAIQELCQEAGKVYRQASLRRGSTSRRDGVAASEGRSLGVALQMAALLEGESESLARVIRRLKTENPDAANALGL
ncbi:ATP-binding protein [Tessaracoccus oleiagri]|uniref:Histidine kinase-, DNA gyrase B-, and HSP90-like ATPase n=1 Tax=Tessaracoccus oleiagri TaxID=686624 RepID=A0A1G9HZQ2_9ACTN|nr:ATP-binding protein [Tessaracoccus oleiagri]SDL18460.1 Histidine kinase-, DNA gyrase B-, and HSP90-like ATPase [Tessaracoccus oleiagri]